MKVLEIKANVVTSLKFIIEPVQLYIDILHLLKLGEFSRLV